MAYSKAVHGVTIQLDTNSSEPAYQQIVGQFRVHLNSGALAAGEQLPSVRSLAAQLGVHFNTIAEAYRELALEGWIDLGRGRRAVVLALSAQRHLPRAEADALRQRLHHLLAEMLLKGISAATIQQDIQMILDE